MFYDLTILDSVRLNFSPAGLNIMNITLAFIMFGIALDLKFDQFKNVLKNPKSLFVGIGSQFILLPALTFLLVWLIQPSPAVAFGMILVSACPGGNISNFMSHNAKANTALSISLTAIATTAALFMTPLNFKIWGSLYIQSSPLLVPLDIDTWQMFKTIFLLLGIPLILGILFSKYYPNITSKIVKPFRIFSFVAFLGFVAAAFSSNFDHFLNYIPPIFLIVLLHNTLALLTGFSVASIFKRPRADRRTITIETGIQNSGLGLILIFNPKIFPPELELGGMAFIAAWWGIWHILSGLVISTIWARKKLPEAELNNN
ncbi:MAG: bile acid:sodium symporter family protein [Bacteroidales bacterium]|nr:bile acid:sodium symporter family protein [Bacteroidales bacterium]